MGVTPQKSPEVPQPTLSVLFQTLRSQSLPQHIFSHPSIILMTNFATTLFLSGLEPRALSKAKQGGSGRMRSQQGDSDSEENTKSSREQQETPDQHQNITSPPSKGSKHRAEHQNPTQNHPRLRPARLTLVFLGFCLGLILFQTLCHQLNAQCSKP